MQTREIAQIKKRFELKPFTHIHQTEKEYDLGSSTGDYICKICGEAFYNDGEPEITVEVHDLPKINNRKFDGKSIVEINAKFGQLKDLYPNELKIIAAIEKLRIHVTDENEFKGINYFSLSIKNFV